ncbi:hypothetical protein ACNOYE_24655 [Nannocystaceae bacterium ST9]
MARISFNANRYPGGPAGKAFEKFMVGRGTPTPLVLGSKEGLRSVTRLDRVTLALGLDPHGKAQNFVVDFHRAVDEGGHRLMFDCDVQFDTGEEFVCAACTFGSLTTILVASCDPKG